ncbi:hypothetical protein [Paraburkholderia sp. J67]|uniref:hypothetical protein n=1 Tax=Paraburkholderia sp. J67 TaxID=2805435 RepID=UPI002ABE92E3|nr:hypothetical protein [Paraburkholderia sp. J67]
MKKSRFPFAFLLSFVALTAHYNVARADEKFIYENCMQHLGGGYGDYLCYGMHATKLNDENKKLAKSLRSARHTTAGSRKQLTKYMRAQDDIVSACDLIVNFVSSSQEELAAHTHIDMYDVLAANCRYTIRKQENEFLKGLRATINGG